MSTHIAITNVALSYEWVHAVHQPRPTLVLAHIDADIELRYVNGVTMSGTAPLTHDEAEEIRTLLERIARRIEATVHESNLYDTASFDWPLDARP